MTTTLTAPDKKFLANPPVQAGSRFQYVHSGNFPDLLKQVEASLAITTYQAGKLALFREKAGRLSMLPRTFDQAMGLAVRPDRLAIGTKYQIWELRNAFDPPTHQFPPGPYDACYLPRASHVTGDIDCHELAWGGEELWIVNTMFSCLCTLDPDFSFVPRWKPPFVSQIAAQDRCHLNGLAMRNGLPNYVTAFGETDTPEGWRDGKVGGGIVMDVASGEVVASGLAMPHSPRWHEDQLWLLDSGRGRLITVELATGKTETIAELPSYTRGLAFAGPYAFVGLSKIRESRVFGSVPVADGREDRPCGVAVIDTRSGKQIGFLEIQEGIEELFDVQLLNGIAFPEVVGFQRDAIQKTHVIAAEQPLDCSPK